MYKKKEQPNLQLDDEQRRRIWICQTPLGRVQPESSVFHHWYGQIFPAENLPARMTETNWWPIEGDTFELDAGPSTEAWLAENWPDLQKAGQQLAELCWLRRADRLAIADALSIFWAEHRDRALALMVNIFIPTLQPRDQKVVNQVISTWHEGGTWRPKLEEKLFELFEDSDKVLAFVEEFFGGVVQRYFVVAQPELLKPKDTDDQNQGGEGSSYWGLEP